MSLSWHLVVPPSHCNTLQHTAIHCSTLLRNATDNMSPSMAPIYIDVNRLKKSCDSSCVPGCCRVLQCVAVYCSVLQCVTVCCSVLQSVAVCCSVSQSVTVCRRYQVTLFLPWDLKAVDGVADLKQFVVCKLKKLTYHI